MKTKNAKYRNEFFNSSFRIIHNLKCKKCAKDGFPGYLIENRYGVFCALCGECIKEKRNKKWWREETPFGVRINKKAF